MLRYNPIITAVVALLFLVDSRSLVDGKVSMMQESDAVTRRRDLRAAMGRWSQSLADESVISDEEEFKELKADSSPLGIVEAGRYLIDRDIMNR